MKIPKQPRQTATRLLQYLGRAVKNYRGGIQEDIFFLHVPKCGGTSINKAIINQYALHDIVMELDGPALRESVKMQYNTDTPFANDRSNMINFMENILLYYLNLPAYSPSRRKYIVGQFHYCREVFSRLKDEFILMTVLRHPVKRWVSNYFYGKSKHLSGHGPIRQGVDVRWERKELQDYIQNYLGSRDFRKSAFCKGYQFIHQFCDYRSGLDYESSEAVGNARENLMFFDLVGSLEHLEDFVQQFKNRFGVTLDVPHRKQNPFSNNLREQIVTDEALEKIEVICAPDISLYESVCREKIEKINNSAENGNNPCFE